MSAAGVPPPRDRVDQALTPARLSAYPPGEYVGQESFMTARGILELAERAGVRAGTRVLDVCCGAGGPGVAITGQLGCRYVGADRDPTALALARGRARAAGLPCRFVHAAVPPLPAGPFEVVLLLETVLAFRRKRPLLDAVGGALADGGRFACTLEEGEPLTAAERSAMPQSDTVWPVPLPEFEADLAAAGLEVVGVRDDSPAHATVAAALAEQFTRRRRELAAELGEDVVDGLIASHRLWADWIAAGRIRKVALLARRL